MKKEKMKLWNKIVVGILVIILMAVIGIIAYKLYELIDMDNMYQAFKEIPTVETKGKLSYNKEENYAKVEGMDYVFQDGIGVKIDSISITDDTFKANINLKLNKEFDYKMLNFSYAVYDENKNIYEISTRMRMGENEKYDYNMIFMGKELGVYGNKGLNRPHLASSSGSGNISSDESEKIAINGIEIETRDKFPKSKKIYIKIFDIGYFEASKGEDEKLNVKNFDLSDAKWLFEFDIPEEMNKRETINLKLENEIPGLEISKITLTETKFVMNFKSEDYLNLIASGKDMVGDEFRRKCEEMLNITDGEGNKYQEAGGGTTGDGGYSVSFNITKKDLAKKLFINFKVGDKEYKSELIESK
ncbi:MAG: hypothetical protein ACLVA2_06050 [Clostridia bacterium]